MRMKIESYANENRRCGMHRGSIRRPLNLIIVAISLILATLVPKPIALAGPPGATGKWSLTGDLNTARSGHTATLLPSGKVLVVGGENGRVKMRQNYRVTLKSAELYDPASGTWSFTGSLNTARQIHTATLLPDGKVLVAGGADFNGIVIGSAELYDPTSGTWSFTGSLNTARDGHTATLLPDGKVLVAGGQSLVGDDGDSVFDVTSAELYDPATGTWTITGNLNAARYAHAATLLQNGKVLVAGGAAHDFFHPVVSSSELYDLNTGVWSVTGGLNTGRSWYTATILPDGSVLSVGGQTFSGLTVTAELYNAAAGTWTYTGSLTLTERASHTATLLVNGQVLVAGGSGQVLVGGDGGDFFFASSGIYDPGAGAWRKTGSLNTDRRGHTATLLQNGNVLVAGGISDGRISKGPGLITNFLGSAELYDPNAPGPGPAPRINSVIHQRQELFVAGEDFDDGAVILLKDVEQATENYTQYPENLLIGRKAGRKIKPGDKIQVRNSTGELSPEFTFGAGVGSDN
jgi:N-acetylneuraminic acid mutarotase